MGIQMNFDSQQTGDELNDQRTHPHLRRSQKQGQAADGVRRMVRGAEGDVYKRQGEIGT